MLFPPYFWWTWDGCKIVIVIHDDVDEKVECDDEPLHCGLRVEVGPGEDGCKSVVVPMKEFYRVCLVTKWPIKRRPKHST